MLHPSREGIAKISRSFAGIRYCAPLLFTDRIMTSLLCRINVRTLAAWRGIKWLRGCKCVVRHDLIKRTGGAPRAVKRPEDIYALTPLRFQGYGSSGEAESVKASVSLRINANETRCGASRYAISRSRFPRVALKRPSEAREAERFISRKPACACED